MTAEAAFVSTGFSDTESPIMNTAAGTAIRHAEVVVNHLILGRPARLLVPPLYGQGPSKTTTGTATAGAAGAPSVTDLAQQRRDAAVVKLPAVSLTPPKEITLQEWEGQIQEVGTTSFLARLVDLTADEHTETEEVQLPLSDISEGDLALVRPGAVFRWIIGYRYTGAVKERFDRLVIRRLPMWTPAEISSADREARELHDALFANGTASPARSG
jgi:hypothetical protein